MMNIKNDLCNQEMTGFDRINPLNHPICFALPDRLNTSDWQTSAWIEHAPFGMFLMDILRPDILVELGTHTGFSYCCFCQAVLRLGLGTRCFAIDAWGGDDQAGHYGPEVLTELREYHDPLYGGFSTLVQSTFDDAVNYFSDGSIDLLHIDGFHTYEAAKHDFKTWLPKLSNRGIVLFHDTNVRERDFGIWRLWAELIQKYPGFQFFHGYGLGILCCGSESSYGLEGFISMPEEQKQGLRRFFFYLGSKLTLELQRKQGIRYFQQQIIEKDQTIERLMTQSAELDRVKDTPPQDDTELEKIQAPLSQREIELDRVQSALSQREIELDRVQSALSRRELEFEQVQGTLFQREIELDRVQSALSRREIELDRVQSTLSRREIELDRVQGALSRRELEFEQVQGTLFRRDIELGQAQGQLSQLGVKLDALRNNAHRLSDELELSRNRKVLRWLDRLFNTGDLSNDISPAFQQLRDDSFIFTKNLKGYRLQSSINLQQVPYLQYPLDLNRPGLKGILLAPVLELPMLQGLLAIEIVSPSNTIVTQSIFPAVQIIEGAPVLFEFPPILNSDQGRFWLRVFVQEIDGPVRIFEWRKYSFIGLGRLKTKPFCGLQFS